jgi:heme-degrading monooxygenase HmoA
MMQKSKCWKVSMKNSAMNGTPLYRTPEFQGNTDAIRKSVDSPFALPLPWMQSTAHQKRDEYHCLASALPLNRYRDVPRFLKWTLRIRRQLKTMPGLVGYSLKANLFRKTFATLSVWESPQAMMAFVRSGDHQKMLVDMKGRLGTSRIVEWKARDKDLPLTWKIAVEKLEPSV